MEGPSPGRRFTLLDGLILVAAPAAGLGVLRGMSGAIDWMGILGVLIARLSWTRESVGEIVGELVRLTMPSAASTTLAVLALRLRPPRPAWRRLARQPGLMACLVLVGAWVVAGLFASLQDGVKPWDDPGYWLQTFTKFGSTLGGFAVATCWTTLALARRWRAEPSWLDRLGRAAGAAWIAMGAVEAFDLRQGFH